MKVLVTGGSGFIGTNIIGELLNKGHEVLNVDIKIPKDRAHLNYWRNIDINIFEDIDSCLISFQPDYIIHLSARTDLNGKSMIEYKTNVQGVSNLMKSVNSLIGLKKIIIASSMLVCKSGYVPKNQFDYCPTTIYGLSKVETERIVWMNKPTCDWAIIRPTSIWGPWFEVPYRNYFELLLAKKYFHIGNKSCVKTYGYIGNTVHQIFGILFADTLNESNKIFYVGDYEETNIEDWSNQIASELGYKLAKIPYFFVLMIAFIGDFFNLVKISLPLNTFRLRNMTTNNVVDLSNTKDMVPHLPYTRKEGIRATLDWMKSQRFL